MKAEKIFDHVLVFCLPQVLLEGTPWLASWRAKERAEFQTLAKVFLLFAAVLYLGHYFLFDKPMGLEPTDHWLTFRVTMTSIALATLAYYWSPLARGPMYRAPLVLACLAFCYSQARVTVWYPEAPWLYCFLFVGICALVLRASVLKSVLFAGSAMSLQVPSLLEAGLPLPTLFSAAFVTTLLIFASRSGYVGDIRYFLLTQQNADSQRRNIELNIEFTDKIKSFIPGEIARRLDALLQQRSTTVLQAIDEVLRPRKRVVACLFSDIRGFTEASKELDSFVGDLVLPNVKACTAAIDERGGIPRKIGDLIFAYFDNQDAFGNLVQALQSAFEIAEINKVQNSLGANGKVVSRYILISTGEAIVGNVGGFDSSVEITALGSPVNLLSRIDELTKHPKLAAILESEDIVLSQSAHELLLQKGVELWGTVLDIREMGLEVRNFPEQQYVVRIAPSAGNRDQVEKLNRLVFTAEKQNFDARSSEAA